MKRIFFISILILTINSVLNAQFQIGVTIGGVGYHPIEDNNSDFYKWKLDKKGKLVGYAGISFFFTYRVNQYYGFKVQQSIIFHDCAGKFAGITHVGINLYDDLVGFNSQSNELSLSFGPFWYYRRNWYNIQDYTNNPEFITLSKSKIWETKFIWHGGQIEYNHKISEHLNTTINILPGYPYLYTFGLGIQNR